MAIAVGGFRELPPSTPHPPRPLARSTRVEYQINTDQSRREMKGLRRPREGERSGIVASTGGIIPVETSRISYPLPKPATQKFYSSKVYPAPARPCGGEKFAGGASERASVAASPERVQWELLQYRVVKVSDVGGREGQISAMLHAI